MSPIAVSARANIHVSATVALLLLCGPTLAAGPFTGFAGTWKGGGTIQTDGGQEAIRCNARYTAAAGDSTLNIDVNCASDSYRVDIVSNVVAQGSSLSGSWQETTRQISGDVSGIIPEPNTLQANLQTLGGGFTARRTNGWQKAVYCPHLAG